jgi:3-methylcrotonyl-CoA carboxylase alpha subunit
MKTLLHINGEAIELDAVQKKPSDVRFILNGKEYSFLGRRQANGSFVLDEETPQGWRRQTGVVSAAGKGEFRVALGAREIKISPVVAGVSTAATASALSPTAPMPGIVRQILVKKGEKVKSGQALVVMEAMKLQTTLTAGGDGIVEAVLVKEGELVSEGAELVKLVPLPLAGGVRGGRQ